MSWHLGFVTLPRPFKGSWKKFWGISHLTSASVTLTTLESLVKILKMLREICILFFGKLCDAGLNLKPKKCSLFQEEVTYIGHLVSEKGIQYDSEKTRVVENWPRPESKRDVRSFLGFVVSTTEDLFKRFLKSRCP